MRRFAHLHEQLDASATDADKLAALVRYFGQAPPADAAWAVHFLVGGRPRRSVSLTLLRETACRAAGVDDWLFDVCQQATGDLAETIAHLVPAATAASDIGLADWVQQRLLPLRGLPDDAQAQHLATAWAELDSGGRFLMGKLVDGGFRAGISRQLVRAALAAYSGLDAHLLALRLAGWPRAAATPDADGWRALLAPADTAQPGDGRPYPFCLARALQAAPESLGDCSGWQVQWQYDGLRAQLVKRAGQVWIWSDDGELVTDRVPEVASAAAALPDGTVLDGELLVWPQGAAVPASPGQMQQRLRSKRVGRKQLDSAPVRMVAHDLLEHGGQDWRCQPQHVRRGALEAVLAPGAAPSSVVLGVSPALRADSWAGLAALRDQARERGAQGLTLKSRDGTYGSGEPAGVWWTCKPQPLSVDAVLVYAQTGRRPGVYTDYSFAVWSRAPADAAEADAAVRRLVRGEPASPGALHLLPFAKTSSGLSDADLQTVDRFIRAHTLQKFGPVCSVRPTLVLQIGFEALAASARHKSGVAVRMPCMLRLRPDKALHEADSMLALGRLMQRG